MKRQKTIFFVSDQPILKGANQVQKNILDSLLSEFNVILFMDSLLFRHYDKQLFVEKSNFINSQNLKIIYYQSIFDRVFYSFSGLFSFFPSFKRLNGKSDFISPNSIYGFIGVTKGGFLSLIRFYMKWSTSFFSMVRHRKYKPDLILGFEVGGTVSAEWYARLFHLPLVTKYMGTILYPYIKNRKSHLLPQYTRAMKAHSDLVLMLNDGTKGDKVLRSFGINESKIRFSIDGVDKEKLKKSKISRIELSNLIGFNLNKEDIILLNISNHNSTWKRIDRCIHALNDLKKNKITAKLILTGKGKNTEHLIKLTNHLGLGNSVYFLDRMPHAVILQLLFVSDFLLNTNDVSNLSHTVLEGLCMGKTIITMDDGSLDGLIKDNYNGVLINPNESSPMIANRIATLINNSHLYNLISRNALKSSKEIIPTWDEKNIFELNEIKSLLNISGSNE